MNLYNKQYIQWQQCDSHSGKVFVFFFCAFIACFSIIFSISVKAAEKDIEIKELQHIEYYHHWKRFKKMKKLYKRAASGDDVVDEINYKFLRFDMGEAGEKLLNKLLLLHTHPRYDAIKRNINEVRLFQTWAEWQDYCLDR